MEAIEAQLGKIVELQGKGFKKEKRGIWKITITRGHSSRVEDKTQKVKGEQGNFKNRKKERKRNGKKKRVSETRRHSNKFRKPKGRTRDF